MWKEYSKRAVIVLGGVGALWIVGHLVGRYAIKSLDGFDKAISAAVNPDAYFPGFDEFFRAVSDYSNLLILLPMLSLAIAIGVYNLTQMPLLQAIKLGAKTCLIFWMVLLLLKFIVGIPLLAFLLLALIPLLIIIIGAVPPLVFNDFCPRRWIFALLCVEFFVVIALWFGHKLWWNDELPGANYILFPCLCCALALVIRMFIKLDNAGMKRFIGVFWLVVLSGIVLQLGPTQNLKKSIARPRPLNDVYKPWSDTLRVIPEERLTGNNSFPSGHVSGTVSLITPLFWWARTRRVKAGFLVWGFMQGASRVYTVAHFTSDCLIGAVLGFGAGTLIFFVLGGPGLREPEAAVEEHLKVATSR